MHRKRCSDWTYISVLRQNWSLLAPNKLQRPAINTSIGRDKLVLSHVQPWAFSFQNAPFHHKDANVSKKNGFIYTETKKNYTLFLVHTNTPDTGKTWCIDLYYWTGHCLLTHRLATCHHRSTESCQQSLKKRCSFWDGEEEDNEEEKKHWMVPVLDAHPSVTKIFILPLFLIQIL